MFPWLVSKFKMIASTVRSRLSQSPSLLIFWFEIGVACSQTLFTLYFLFKVRRARVIKNKLRGIYWPPAHRGSGGRITWDQALLLLFFCFFASLALEGKGIIGRGHDLRLWWALTLAHADVFQKKDKKNKTTSVYSLKSGLHRKNPSPGARFSKVPVT